ncbi:MAG: Uma2 family endonuclease [Prochlorothrix sp.]|nr:Uma2 family endonuclease [Prochlorothrix sp.]
MGLGDLQYDGLYPPALAIAAPMYEFQPRQKPLPTMYELPSEEVGDSGLPDEFHRFQAELLTETCQSPWYPGDRCFTAIDLNLYYDPRNPQRYKRPDWFLALDVGVAQRQEALRWSYLIWQEGVPPFLVVELLSPGTEGEDLGRSVRGIDQPPGKWEVYERLLRVPYYAIYDRYENQFRLFRLQGMRYEALVLVQGRYWLEELGLGLGVWEGEYQGIQGRWLRWYDQAGHWIPLRAELLAQEQHDRQLAEAQLAQEQHDRQLTEAQLAQEQERAAAAEAQYQALLAKLRAQGINPEDL